MFPVYSLQVLYVSAYSNQFISIFEFDKRFYVFKDNGQKINLLEQPH